ncbi:hypothetical protein ACFLX4_03990 [Chloroflexota bacterium]
MTTGATVASAVAEGDWGVEILTDRGFVLIETTAGQSKEVVTIPECPS